MADESSYMVFTEDGQRHGPLPKHRVLELLERGFISESAEVEHDSTGRAPLPLHPHFAGFFIEGDSRNEEFRKKRAVRTRRSRKMRGRRRRRLAGRVLLGVAAVAGIASAVVYWEVIATAIEPYLGRSSGAEAESSAAVARSGGPTKGQGELHEKHLAELSATFGAVSGAESVSALEHVELGWRGLVGRGLRSDERIRGHMEQAVHKSGGKPWALAGLVTATLLDSAEIGNDDPVLKMAMDLLVASKSPSDIALAKSVKAFSSGGYEESAQNAQACLAVTPGHAECLLFSAIAAGRAGRTPNSISDRLLAAQNVYPESAELLVWQQVIAFEEGDVSGAKEALAGIKGEKSSPIYFGLSAQIEERLGNWNAAYEAYLEHFNWDSNAVESGLKAAILGYQVEGRLKEAQNLLKLLAKIPKLTPSQRSRIALHASHAARMAGDFERAVALAEEAAGSVVQRRYLVLAQAMAYAELGRRKEVDARIVEINQSSFEGRESARYHAWLAKYYLQSDRVQLALWALQNAEAADPHWGLLASFGIEIDVRVGNLSRLPKRLEDAVGRDLAQEKMREPWSTIPHLGSTESAFLEVMERTLKGNIYYADSLDIVSGVWLLTGCDRPHSCHSAEKRLLRASKGEKQAVVAQLGLLHIYSDREDWERVGDLLEVLRPSRSATAAYLAFQGGYLLNTGKIQGALRAYRQVAQLLPNSSLGPRGLVRVYQRLGDPQGMRAALAAVRRLDPNDSVTAAVSLKEGVAR